jgi:hypothetical protein
VRSRVGLPRAGDLAWHDRVRTLASIRATELVPLADRAGIASRWIERVGLGHAVGQVRDDSLRPAVAATFVRALCERAGERAYVSGRASVSATGAVELTGAVLEAVAFVIPRDERVSARFGLDRVHTAVAEALGRRLFLNGAFLAREASVDRGAREPVLLELLYSELFVVRTAAALARFEIDVLSRAADLPARMREYLGRATGSAPSPMWAAHLAAAALEGRSAPRALAALVEPRLHDVLREKHDEDWFRNPRAGETLRDRMDALRTRGTLNALSESREVSLDPGPLAKRVSEAMDAARR